MRHLLVLQSPQGFKDAHVTVHNLDQMQYNGAKLRDILGTHFTGKLNIVIDDGCHTRDAWLL